MQCRRNIDLGGMSTPSYDWRRPGWRGLDMVHKFLCAFSCFLARRMSKVPLHVCRGCAPCPSLANRVVANRTTAWTCHPKSRDTMAWTGHAQSFALGTSAPNSFAHLGQGAIQAFALGDGIGAGEQGFGGADFLG